PHRALSSFPTRRSSDLRCCTDRRNRAVAYQHGAIANDAEPGQRTTAPWNASRDRQQLRRSCNEKGIAQGLVIMTNLALFCLLATDRKSTRLNSSHQIIS